MRFKIAVFWCLLFCLSLSQAASAQAERLVFALDVIRHGDRSPIVELPDGVDLWKQGMGQLTPEGMAQEFKLGCTLKDEYITKTHLLPETYRADEMYVRSTDIDRTLMSAQCVLQGLYAGKGPSSMGRPVLPFGYQPIPVHTKPFNEDLMLVVDFNPKLPAALKTVYSSPAWKEEEALVRPHFAHWSDLTQMPIMDLMHVSELADIIRIRELHKVPLPKGMTEADAKEIIDAGEWAFTQSYKSPEVGRAGSTQILDAIADYFEQVRKERTHLKFVLFSSHDTTIASIMGALGVPLDRRPPYASDLNFSLYKQDKSFTVRIKFNGKSISLPGTTGGTASGAINGGCSLEQFLQIIPKG